MNQTENKSIQVGDIVVFDRIPSDHFDISKAEWTAYIVCKRLRVAEITHYAGKPAFRADAPVNGCDYYYPTRGARVVASITTPGSVVSDRKASSTMKKYNGPLNRVFAVIKGSPADKAGVKEGDVITRIGAINVNPEVPLGDYIQRLGPGRSITMKVNRGGQVKVIKRFELGENKDGDAVLGVINTPKRAQAYKVKQAQKAITKPAPVAAPKTISPEMTWEQHQRQIRENKARMEEQARIASAVKAKSDAEKAALADSLAKTKAEAEALKAKNDEAKTALALAEQKAEEDNHFLKQAKSEMEGVQALLADMKGADALLQAKALRAKLRSKNLNRMEQTAADVNAYLNETIAKREKEETLPPLTTRRISFKRVAVALSSVAAITAVASVAYANFVGPIGLFGF